ncbi:MAG: hypothetical protein ABL933_11995 [Methyloglobulus sp.]
MNPIDLSFYSTFSPPKPFDAKTERQFLHDYSARHATRQQVAAIVGLGICLAYFGVDLLDAINDKQFWPIFTGILR